MVEGVTGQDRWLSKYVRKGMVIFQPILMEKLDRENDLLYNVQTKVLK